MYIDKEHFDGWMRRIMERFDRLEKLNSSEPAQNIPLLPDGDRLLDNFDLCQMLNVSKRTLQRYRSSSELPFQMIYHKTYYKESDVIRFIEKHFSSFRNMNKNGNK